LAENPIGGMLAIRKNVLIDWKSKLKKNRDFYLRGIKGGTIPLGGNCIGLNIGNGGVPAIYYYS
jgi:hypothetical protein